MISTFISLVVVGLLSGASVAEAETGATAGEHATTFECASDDGLPEPTETASGQPYYIIGNYECEETDGDSAGKCQVTTRHEDSCQAACNAHRQDVRSRNVCSECVKGRRYPGKRWNGRVTFSQGGPCQGMSCRP